MSDADTVLRLKARWALPVEAAPIDGALVTIAGDRIVEVCRATPHTDTANCRDLGDVAILPGLVNAHTHLEFSGLAAPLGRPGQVFPDWIREVIAWRRSQAPSEEQPLAAGLRESLAAGVTTIGEIATSDWPPGDLHDSPADVTAFRELIGLDPARITANLATAREHIAQRESSPRELNWRAGLSPHAPYTVHPVLLGRAVHLSAATRVPVAMHLAESREELELLDAGKGPFVELLKELNAWHADAIPPGTRPIAYLRELARAHRALVIHGNYLDQAEVAFLAEHAARMSVVYCPRTHAYFGHEPYRLSEYLSSGVAMALGTDSRASNPDLSLWREMQFVAAEHRDVSPAQVLELGTLGGARALGLAHELGSLRVGNRADLALVALGGETAGDPHELLFDEEAQVVGTLVRGREVAAH